ncbi:transposable element Tcb2 transposase [Trichonephila clavipes]|nr:transposable element Tcb2 transposase [Trichonephila clavipes]
MEAGWSPRRVARQLGHSDCVVKRCWDQWIQTMSFTQRPGSGCPRQTSCRADRDPMSFLTKRRRLAGGHLGSRSPLRVLPLKPIHRRLRLEWCRARGNWTAAEWNQVIFIEESRFNLSNDVNRIRVWRPRGEHLNSAFALQRHTSLTAGVMVWDVIAYNTRSSLVLIRGTMTAQRYVHDILQPHVLPLMQRVP